MLSKCAPAFVRWSWLDPPSIQVGGMQELALTAELLWSRLASGLSPSPNGHRWLQRLIPTQSAVDFETTQAARESRWSLGALSRCIVEASPDCIEVLDPKGNLQYANPTALRQLRSGSTSENEGEPWSLSWSNEAQGAVVVALNAARELGSARFSQWRPDTSGAMRCWDVAVSPMHNDAGELTGLLAVSRDITALAQARAEQDLSNRELIHRLKNLFALINGLVTLSARSLPLVQPYARTLRDRLISLDRALAYLHPPRLSDASPPPVQTLQALLRTLLMPYEGGKSAQRRFKLFDGADIPIRDTAVTSLALIIHELTTNAIKHGALSNTIGTISLSCRRYKKIVSLIWRERDGPAITQVPEHTGFGSVLVRRSAEGQLGGKMAYQWRREGLRVVISIPIALLAPPGSDEVSQ